MNSFFGVPPKQGAVHMARVEGLKSRAILEGRVVASSSTIASEFFSLPASARASAEIWSLEESHRHYGITLSKGYSGALKGLQEGDKDLHHNSEPIVLVHHYREQVFRRRRQNALRSFDYIRTLSSC